MRNVRRIRRAGFTLVEMMVVIVIIGILAGVVITQLAGKDDQAKAAATKALISQVSGALDMYKLDHNKYPRTLDDLLNPPPDVDPKKWPPGGYLKKAPLDGWDKPFLYRVPGIKGQPYDIISLGQDEREGGEGHAQDIWNHEAWKK